MLVLSELFIVVIHNKTLFKSSVVNGKRSFLVLIDKVIPLLDPLSADDVYSLVRNLVGTLEEIVELVIFLLSPLLLIHVVVVRIQHSGLLANGDKVPSLLNMAGVLKRSLRSENGSITHGD